MNIALFDTSSLSAVNVRSTFSYPAIGTSIIHIKSGRSLLKALMLLFALIILTITTAPRTNAQSPHFKYLRAVERNNVEEALSYIQKGISPDTRRRGDGTPALIIAAREGHTRVMKLILEQGGNPDIQEREQGQTALIIRTTAGDAEDVQLLIEKGAKVDVADRGLETALTKAVRLRKHRIARILLKAGADPEKVDITGNSPADYARISRDRRMARLLTEVLDKKANTNTLEESP